MKQVLFSIAVFCALFFNSNLSTLLGFQNNVTTVAFLPITLFLFSQIVKKEIFILCIFYPSALLYYYSNY